MKKMKMFVTLLVDYLNINYKNSLHLFTIRHWILTCYNRTIIDNYKMLKIMSNSDLTASYDVYFPSIEIIKWTTNCK